MNDTKQRHGCLTAWLVLMIVINAATALIYLFGSGMISESLPSSPGWLFPVLAVASIFNVICAVVLFKWKKWGFYGFVVTSVVAFVINLMIGINPAQAFLGLVGLAILYGVLQIGGERKGWAQLE
jgi:hypothetical protein